MYSVLLNCLSVCRWRGHHLLWVQVVWCKFKNFWNLFQDVIGWYFLVEFLFILVLFPSVLIVYSNFLLLDLSFILRSVIFWLIFWNSRTTNFLKPTNSSEKRPSLPLFLLIFMSSTIWCTIYICLIVCLFFSVYWFP